MTDGNFMEQFCGTTSWRHFMARVYWAFGFVNVTAMDFVLHGF